QCLIGMPGCADRIAHIVETIKKADEIIVVTRVILGRRLRKGHTVRDPTVRRALCCGSDRRGMIVKAEKTRCGIGLRHHDRRGAMSAPHIGDRGSGFKLRDNPCEGGQPLGDQVSPITWPEEALGASKHRWMVITPGESAIATHSSDHLVLV